MNGIVLCLAVEAEPDEALVPRTVGAVQNGQFQ